MTHRTWTRAALALLSALAATGAGADVFSPGELARPHAALEGLSNCTKCHATKAGGKIEGFNKEKAHALCQGCHKEAQKGPTKCAECHKK